MKRLLYLLSFICCSAAAQTHTIVSATNSFIFDGVQQPLGSYALDLPNGDTTKAGVITKDMRTVIATLTPATNYTLNGVPAANRTAVQNFFTTYMTAASGGGSSSVSITAGAGISVSPNPITGTGTISLSLLSGLSNAMADQGSAGRPNGIGTITVTCSLCTASSIILVTGKDNGNAGSGSWGRLSISPASGSFTILSSINATLVADTRQVYYTVIKY